MSTHTQYDKCDFSVIDGRVKVTINGRSLIDMLAEYEHPFAESEGFANIAGGYGFVDVFDFRDRTEYEDNSTVLLLGCGECSEATCWPMFANEFMTDDAVVWDNFRQPFRPNWNYSEFGPFTFNKMAFDKQLRDISDIGNDSSPA